MAEHFPAIQGGGSLILAWQVRGKRVLVVGGGEVAAGRIVNVLNADAKVTVVSPADGLNDEVAYRIAQKQVDYVDRKFVPSDLDGVDMVLTAVDDPEASTQVYKLCKERRIPANIADVPPECDFYFGSVHRDGPLQIMVSTNGNGPRLANIVRRQIAATLPPNVGAAIQKVGQLRRKLRKVAPGPEEGPKRMQWMSKVCESWSLDDLVEMDDSDMEKLLGFYKPNTVPSFPQVRYGDKSNAVDPDLTEIRSSTNDKVDFHDPRAVRQLTASLLKREFGLVVDLPPDRLCPPDLVESIIPSYYDSFDHRQVIGLDIGCGASCIYTLLALKTRPTWRMNATDIDPLNFSHALRNVQANGFSPRCHVMKTKPNDPLIPLVALELDHLDFTICNPPFFSSVEEWKASITGEGKAKGPNSVCTGAQVEMVTEGGDLGFVLRMVEESRSLGEKVACIRPGDGPSAGAGAIYAQAR
ncbi:siroheme synthase [Macrophomina phaseolina]|uniref:precorrin-2 dehydrogenase n=1 Tax=Macrophomina phaseolina TaxID=35725 RepID=A0ABQ8GCS9_9PEZI|nr:siroheme synthase [Macrophomina phaseolina]